MQQYRFSLQFYIGIVLIILSLIIGNVTKVFILLYFNDPDIRWISLIIYVLSWPILIVGAWWAGRETYQALKRYFSYRFYHQHLKEGTKRVYHRTQELKEKVRRRMHRGKRIARMEKESLNNPEDNINKKY